MRADNLPRLSGPGYDFVFIRRAPPENLDHTSMGAALIQPIKRMELIATVNMLLNISDFTSFGIKKKMAAANLDEKKTIESAKSLLIARNYFTEAQAHRFIQKKSMDAGKKMVETALIILNS
ncbi:MAG: ANTAR domain-containing protein [Clostridiales bacterium]|nr:ANTAR domain-containing protein [Clostridiales bacterium]